MERMEFIQQIMISMINGLYSDPAFDRIDFEVLAAQAIGAADAFDEIYAQRLLSGKV